MNSINIKNKKAYFDFELSEKLTAGIQLTGTEIKSIRLGKASLVDSFCFFKDRELWVKGVQIAEYAYSSFYNHDPNRIRKLLLNRKELNKMERKVKEKGFTIIVTRLFINEKGYAKIEIALARGKREYDKRESIKEKDMKRDMDRLKKVRY